MESIPHEKRCSRCKSVKPAADFYPDASKKTKLSSRCRECVRACTKNSYLANREQKIRYSREYEAAHPERRRAYRVKQYEKCKEQRRANRPFTWSKYVTPGGRACSVCGEIKSPDEFGVQKKSPDGLRATCKACRRADRANNPAPYRDENRRYREKKNKILTPIEKAIEAARKREYAQRDRSKNPSKYVAYTHKRMALKRKNGGAFTREEWGNLCAQYGHRCLCCGEQKKLTVDHVIPVSKGGTNDISNLQPLCQSCNTRKRDKIIDYRIDSPYEVR